MKQPFFETSGENYLPADIARGFWGQETLHARVAIGLLAREIERAHGAANFTPARLTVDLFRMPSLAPATVETRLVRDGARIKLVEADFLSGGVLSARATCQLLRHGEPPTQPVWTPPKWDAPLPDDIPIPDDPTPIRGMWELRPIPFKQSDRSPRRAWLREIRPLVDNEPHSPFTRIATGIDYTSPFSNRHADGLDFINSDVTLYLHRAPIGEWIGYELADHQDDAGVAIGHCALYDVSGRVGFSSCAALAQRRA
ncbi:MAG: acyl-CoA thioesterase domain-containing protein [Caulobacterales bacterium]